MAGYFVPLAISAAVESEWRKLPPELERELSAQLDEDFGPVEITDAINKQQLKAAVAGNITYLVTGIPLWVLTAYLGFAGLTEQKHLDVQIMQERSLQARMEIVDVARAGALPPPFFLYLRPFYADELFIENPRSSALSFLPAAQYYTPAVTWESAFMDRLEDFGRTVSLGQASDSLSADRIESKDDSWMSDFVLLASFAERIFIWPSTRPGTRWEIQWLLDRKLLPKCIFIVPIDYGRLSGITGESWGYVRSFLVNLGFNPPVQPGVLFTAGTSAALTRKLKLQRRRRLRRTIQELLSATSRVQDAVGRRETWLSAEMALRATPPLLESIDLNILLPCVQCDSALTEIVCRDCEPGAPSLPEIDDEWLAYFGPLQKRLP